MFHYLITLAIFTLPFVCYGLLKWPKALLKVAALATPLAAIWDYLAVNVLHIWSFNPDAIVNVWILGLPLEEWLFFILVSMSIASMTLMFTDKLRTK